MFEGARDYKKFGNHCFRSCNGLLHAICFVDFTGQRLLSGFLMKQRFG
jgi:hypothetical protein